MRIRRTLFRLAAAALLVTVSAGPRMLTAQTEVDEGPCKFKTRWKDAYGRCPHCCNAIEHSCPCTT